MLDKIKIFAGNSNINLAVDICKFLGVSLGKSEVKSFSDGEVCVEINESVRGMEVYVIQSTCSPVNKHLMELLIMLDALKRASAYAITAVIPYYGYARQDRKVAPRTPITAKLVADLIAAAGASRVLCMDLHAGQIQGFFDIPVDNLYATPILLEHIQKNYRENTVIVSPDAGGVERARAFAKRLNTSFAIIDKRRPAPNVSEIMNVIGDIQGKACILLDDMIDTAGTITLAADALIKQGAKDVYACCTHPVLSGPAIERLRKSPLKEVIVTNTIPLNDEARGLNKIKSLTVAPLLGEAIKRIHYGESVSSLFV
ncbi:MAG: phosphoribosylpyrophosphate synthetase [Deltaproteobacteria bacterium GWC2_42_51]|nr:MAG: phosphoribosylpyrophosphate synthetase [Deltaproteobacteria bacterium GWB2_42_7]OGP33628.1 MAG: phosphoribosylpyrophosphate synthetase [Deltaproteobacteria bacterium GWC2_42_51]OGP41234.1 MAG: phosphoribosylpyrophosphate synthetase [Deltaproteobacteria bacterium GWD2_42_10]OGP48234.1 MAG: phosphoribosylpyrophosphate synthetase [Deltaproteobacteria bacterium GWF2_42_12]OGQ27009.1 MAG: phosphoribosylpyrophosphate synthetase [Deltaproteobacteria bacterium RIFCSPHIGHO2_02_FULL_42_44]OGQ373